MTDIRADLQQYYPLKAVFEEILGRASFMKVKDYGPLNALPKAEGNTAVTAQVMTA